jgi:hypothetical protein
VQQNLGCLMSEHAEEEQAQEGSPAAPAAPSARQSLVDWANKQDGWVRILVEAILTAPAEVSETTLGSVYER